MWGWAVRQWRKRLRRCERSNLITLSIPYPTQKCKSFLQKSQRKFKNNLRSPGGFRRLSALRKPAKRGTKDLKPHFKSNIYIQPLTPKTITKLQRKFFYFNRNVTKVNRGAQFLQVILEQNAKSDAVKLKLLRFRLIFDAECDILRLRKRLRNLRETFRSSYPRKEAIRCRP